MSSTDPEYDQENPVGQPWVFGPYDSIVTKDGKHVHNRDNCVHGFRTEKACRCIIWDGDPVIARRVPCPDHCTGVNVKRMISRSIPSGSCGSRAGAKAMVFEYRGNEVRFTSSIHRNYSDAFGGPRKLFYVH